MNINKKILSLAAAILATANISAAKAEDVDVAKKNAVLFKIHDIVPVKNAEGEVIGCDYNTTFFNRSNLTIRNAGMEVGWKDTSIETVIENEKKEDAVKNNRKAGRARSTTERITDKTIGGFIDIPTIKPAKQVTVKSRVNTDRCFLLMEPVKFEVNECNAENEQGKAATSRGSGAAGARAGNVCARLFSYVSPDDPQYYLEFKVVTIEDEKAEAEAKQAKQISQVDDMYEKTVKAVDSTNSIVSGIK